MTYETIKAFERPAQPEARQQDGHGPRDCDPGGAGRALCGRAGRGRHCGRPLAITPERRSRWTLVPSQPASPRSWSPAPRRPRWRASRSSPARRSTFAPRAAPPSTSGSERALRRPRQAPVRSWPAEALEDGDILEMVNAGLVPATVVDGYMADLYLQVFPSLQKRADVASQPFAIAWAFRKNSPQLAAESTPSSRGTRRARSPATCSSAST